MKHYYYIFTGAGLSSLMTVYKMALSGRFNDKSVLLIDSNPKNTNDRTWCFWEQGKGKWDNIVSKSWNTAWFAGKSFKKELDFGDYQYKMVSGIDFYTFIFDELKQHPNIEFANQKVIDFADLQNHVLVKTETENYTCNKLFNSIYNPDIPKKGKHPVLQQHFKGWFIKTNTPVFDNSKATFMDFSIPQKGNTRFMYVLPVSSTEALIEYTLFSEHLLAEEEYDTAIKDYITGLGITDYEIADKEKGSIPMTVYPFWKNNTQNIMHIGSAGGWTKASTGYTFKNSDKQSEKLIRFLERENDLRKFYKTNRFWFYDLLLLDILYRTNEKGSEIFAALFKKGNASPVFKFLDEETSLIEDLSVIAKCPKSLFIKALLRNSI
ncbi:lycopene cyclase family protein [Flavobacterium beibuense]|uniref:Lycopene beta cyclase n=1 Tax=Flavobacterium beibuense TaxID=657326 RepID=A0A444WDF9_9FLAO|nr:lycopene cyclase family protein [Flavobacterium beibuense]RYJ43825.1 Lycopene beta cyclase [Flavobacterium beibuense]